MDLSSHIWTGMGRKPKIQEMKKARELSDLVQRVEREVNHVGENPVKAIEGGVELLFNNLVDILKSNLKFD